MYMVAGVLIERVSGMTWEKFVEERLLKPLKMNQTVLTYPELFKSTDYAKSYRKQEDQLVEAGFGSNVDAIGPAGAVKSNAEDMSHWLLMQLQQGKYESQQIISSKSLKENHIPLTVVYPTEAKYPELGLRLMGWDGTKMFIVELRGSNIMVRLKGFVRK
jgi:CubicO group peptidase (beta-lactamase class C family)